MPTGTQPAPSTGRGRSSTGILSRRPQCDHPRDAAHRPLGADTGISKSEVSRICADLDADITALADFPVASLGKPCQPDSRKGNLQRTSALGNDRRGLAHCLKVADMSPVPLIGALEYDENPECVT